MSLRPHTSLHLVSSVALAWPLCLASLVSLAVSGLGAGCSSTSAAVVQMDGGTDAAIDASRSQQAADATPADTVDAATMDASAATDKTGSIFAISDVQSTDAGARSTYRAGASFRRTLMADTRITNRTVGPCLLETFGAGTQAREEPLSAGTIQINGGTVSATLAPKADKSYPPATANQALWLGGETLSVVSLGADVPAFTTTLVAPSSVTLNAPQVSRGTLSIERSAGLRAEFVGASSGDVVLYFDTSTDQAAFSITCTFNANAGGGEIPAAAFEGFPAGEGSFDFYVKATATVQPEGWRVRFTASRALVDSRGTLLTGPARFQ